MQQKKLFRGIDHIGMTVPDVDEASGFLVKAFDAEILYDVQPENAEPMAGKEPEQQLGIPKGAKIVHMRLVQTPTALLYFNSSIVRLKAVDSTTKKCLFKACCVVKMINKRVQKLSTSNKRFLPDFRQPSPDCFHSDLFIFSISQRAPFPYQKDTMRQLQKIV